MKMVIDWSIDMRDDMIYVVDEQNTEVCWE